jgi:endonuclease/exonuclease/phosphatase family metal-dependent hydrolase
MKEAITAWLDSVRVQIGALAGAYGLLVAVYLLLRLLTGEDLALIAFLNNGAHWVTLGAVAAGLVALVAPYRRFWALYALPGALAFLVWFGPLYAPWRPFLPEPDADLSFTVATYNIAGDDGEFRFDYEARTGSAATLGVIGDLDADILGIQEANNEAVIDSLLEVYPYHARHDDLALFSRYPINDDSIFLVDSPERRRVVALRAVVTVEEQPISVYVMHTWRPEVSLRPLGYDGRERAAGIRDAVAAFETEDNPVLVLCDCNLSPHTDDYGVLADVLRDSWRERGFGLGLTAPDNKSDVPVMLLRSDYIWHGDTLDVLAIKVWGSSGDSDHRPLWARFGLELED